MLLALTFNVSYYILYIENTIWRDFMNNTFTCTFFGHRDFNWYPDIEQELEVILERIIRDNYFVEFLVGRNGEFDSFVSSVIRKLKKKFDSNNIFHILVLPYFSAEYEKNHEYYNSYYDEIEYCEESSMAHFKSAITIRNKQMIDRSHLVICYVYKTGGALSAIKYAKETNKNVINLYHHKITF